MSLRLFEIRMLILSLLMLAPVLASAAVRKDVAALLPGQAALSLAEESQPLPGSVEGKPKKKRGWLSRLFGSSTHEKRGPMDKLGPFKTEEDIREEQEAFHIPAVCLGDDPKSYQYWVRGENGTSVFKWEIVANDGSGRRVPYKPIDPKGDLVQILWDQPGSYTIRVVEMHDFGASTCEGDPYVVDSVWVSDPAVPLPIDLDQFGGCSGDPLELNLSGVKSKLNWVDTVGLQRADGQTTIDVVPYFTLDGDAFGTYKVRFYSRKYGCEYKIDVKHYPTPIVKFEPDRRLIYPHAFISVKPRVTIQYDGESERDIRPSDLHPTTPYIWNTDRQNPLPQWAQGLPYEITEKVSGYATRGDSIVVRDSDGMQRDWITVMTNHGCVATDTVEIVVADMERMRIPAVITPNGDGHNDTWLLPAPQDGQDLRGLVHVYDVMVYDRWGKLVYKHRGLYDNNNPWNGIDQSGRPLPMDSYHYEMRIEGKGQMRVIQGTITIVR